MGNHKGIPNVNLECGPAQPSLFSFLFCTPTSRIMKMGNGTNLTMSVEVVTYRMMTYTIPFFGYIYYSHNKIVKTWHFQSKGLVGWILTQAVDKYKKEHYVEINHYVIIQTNSGNIMIGLLF